MTYTALAVAFLLLSIAAGARATAAERPWLAICLAATIVAAQFALLMSS